MQAPDIGNLTLLTTATATNTSGWTQHIVSFAVPVGQESTVFLFRAIQGGHLQITLMGTLLMTLAW